MPGERRFQQGLLAPGFAGERAGEAPGAEHGDAVGQLVEGDVHLLRSDSFRFLVDEFGLGGTVVGFTPTDVGVVNKFLGLASLLLGALIGGVALARLLAGQLKTMGGTLVASSKLRVGYFAQHQLELLRLEESPLWHLQKLDKQATEKDLRNFLGGFDFRGDKVSDPVGPFSGGEKARLVLAMTVWPVRCCW